MKKVKEIEDIMEIKKGQSYLQAAQVGGCSSICMMKGG
jgi:hypothetical protein